MFVNNSSSVPFKSTSFLSLLILVFSIEVAVAGEFYYHDDFNDGDVTDATAGGQWVLTLPLFPGESFDASSGDIVITATGFTLAKLKAVDGVMVPSSTEWSIRARMTLNNGSFAGVGTDVFNHAALIPFNQLRVGTAGNHEFISLPFPVTGQEVMIQMDTFDGIITGSVWKVGNLASRREWSKSYSPEPTWPAIGVGDPSGMATFHEVWISSSPLPIPEPTSLVLVGLCLIAVVGWRRRRH